MQFFKTDTKYLKRIIDHVRYLEKYCPYVLPEEQNMRFNSIIIDDEMLSRGRPYYQVYPEVFEAVSNTTLDLDIDDWKVPFDIFEIRLPKTDKPLIPIQPNSSLGVMSIQIFRNYYKRMFICSAENPPLTYKFLKSNSPEMQSLFTQLVNNTAVKVNICDYNKPQDAYKKQSVFTTLKYEEGVKIRDVTDHTIQRVLNKKDFYSDEPDLDDMSGCALSQVLKLSLGVSLLATASQKILEYDVLAKQLEAYRGMKDKGDTSGYKNIENKAKKKGKFGWNIGKPRVRRLPLSQENSYGNNVGHGSQHNFTSYRCGHWHKYHVGIGRTQVKIKWLSPTVVRPDLPARESA